MKIEQWEVVGNKSLERIFKFKDFKEALGFVNRVGELAEEENHHPDILLFSWNKVRITLTTHKEHRITDKDFNLAEEINKIYSD